jgi:hypothetical protein
VASMNFEFLKSITLNDVKSLYTEADWKEKWLFGWPDPILLRLEIFFRSPTDKQSAAASLYISVWILENDNRAMTGNLITHFRLQLFEGMQPN